MRINIPFQERWREAILDGRKVCTSRGKRYGKPGDTFGVFGSEFELLAVAKVSLEDVSNHLFRQEGCRSPEEFQEIWVELHHRKGFAPEKMVYVHWFSKKQWAWRKTGEPP